MDAGSSVLVNHALKARVNTVAFNQGIRVRSIITYPYCILPYSVTPQVLASYTPILNATSGFTFTHSSSRGFLPFSYLRMLARSLFHPGFLAHYAVPHLVGVVVDVLSCLPRVTGDKLAISPLLCPGRKRNDASSP